MRSGATWLLIIGYTLSMAVCTCREMAQRHSRPAAHACCKHRDSSNHPEPGSCPHCNGTATVALAQKQSMPSPALDIALSAALRALPEPAPVAQDSADAFARPFLPADTLLRLHCALLT